MIPSVAKSQILDIIRGLETETKRIAEHNRQAERSALHAAVQHLFDACAHLEEAIDLRAPWDE